MGKPMMTVWQMEDHLKASLGVLEMDRRVHRVCRYLRPDRECKRCPMYTRQEVSGEEEICQQMCYGLAAEAIAYAHGAVHPREEAGT